MTPSINVASHLARMASEFPDRAAVHIPIGSVNRTGPTPHRTLTYRELNADCDALAHGLQSVGVERGSRVALMVPPGADFFALTFALFKLGAAPVLVDPGMGIKNLKNCLDEAEPSAFIGIPKAHLARRLFGWAKTSIRNAINVGNGRFFCSRSTEELRELGSKRGPFPMPEVKSDELAAILFTSGSTGLAKGAEYTHGIFSAQVEMLKATYGIEPGEVDLCTFPLFALFGPALGMACVVPDMNASKPASLDPQKAASQIKQFGVTQFFGSPAVMNRLQELTPMEDGRLHPDLSPTINDDFKTLKRVISAGAPATVAILEKVSTLLPPGVEIFTPYGATEALPVANIGSSEIFRETAALTRIGKGVCIGKPVQGMTVQIVRISDDAIPIWSDDIRVSPGTVGEFVVRGPVVTKRYFKREEPTTLAKIHDPRTGEVLHRMGDVGYVDEFGRLWFCGRKSHRVETPNGTLFTDQIEPIFNSSMLRTALVGVRRNGMNYPVLLAEKQHEWGQATKKWRWSWGLTQDHYRKTALKFEHTKSIQTFLLHPGFPMDVRHNSKIFREKLAAWADRKLGPKWKGEPV